MGTTLKRFVTSRRPDAGTCCRRRWRAWRLHCQAAPESQLRRAGLLAEPLEHLPPELKLGRQRTAGLQLRQLFLQRLRYAGQQLWEFERALAPRLERVFGRGPETSRTGSKPQQHRFSLLWRELKGMCRGTRTDVLILVLQQRKKMSGCPTAAKLTIGTCNPVVRAIGSAMVPSGQCLSVSHCRLPVFLNEHLDARSLEAPHTHGMAPCMAMRRFIEERPVYGKPAPETMGGPASPPLCLLR
jgi:hypothetical protein